LPHPLDEAFPFPNGYETDLKKKLRAESIKDYVAIFEKRRGERPDGKLADADVQEIMRLAEDLDYVDVTEIDYIRHLVGKHPEYIRPEDTGRLEAFAGAHSKLNDARNDPLVETIVRAVPLDLFRQPGGLDFLKKAAALATAMRESDAHYEKHGVYDNALVVLVNDAAKALGEIVAGFTLTDIDKPGRAARLAYLRDIGNFLLRLGGAKTEHESKFSDGKWVNWNREVEVFPARYEPPLNQAALAALVAATGPLRMVAGGHAFNISSSMGGVKSEAIGTLVTLDRYHLAGGSQWERVSDAQAKYKVSPEQSERVVRVAAGMRLRDFGEAMWEAKMALPVAGSTDAQSLGGLVATDLHSTGIEAGFLSQQILEVKALASTGDVLTFTKDESIARGTPGRWHYESPTFGARMLRKLPVSGALGTAGIVFEIVLKLDAAFNMEKSARFVPREWAEANIGRLLDPDEKDPLFDYDHVSLYYPGGGGGDIQTVRLNSWKRTEKPVSEGADEIKTIRELFDHVGSAFLPEYLIRLGRRPVNAPGTAPGPNDDDTLVTLNKRGPEVLPANKAFARKLFFQHDEIEVGIPLPVVDGKPDYQVFRDAIGAVQDLLAEEEFPTIIEVRFTPDVSEGILGPGTGGPTCYIELATPLGQFSRARIVEVYLEFDRMLRAKYKARPHLGKKTTATFEDMAKLHGQDWEDFLKVRRDADPSDKFLPRQNPLLAQIFKPEGER
jgi:hypothetical protein